MKNKKKNPLIALLIVTVAGLSIWWLFSTDTKTSKGSPQTAVPLRERTPAEIHDFWDRHCDGVFTQGLLVNKYPLPELQSRYNANTIAISNRYKVKHAISPTLNYVKKSREILGSADFDESGRPMVGIIVPAIMDVYASLEEKDKDLVFQTLLASVALHEMDHLGYGSINRDTEKSPLSFDELIEEERTAWALTCKHVLTPLRERYNIRIIGGSENFYEAWVAFGRNADNPEWKRAVRILYSNETISRN